MQHKNAQSNKNPCWITVIAVPLLLGVQNAGGLHTASEMLLFQSGSQYQDLKF